MVKKAQKGPAAEDTGFAEKLNEVITEAGEPGGARKWIELKLGGKISRGELSLTRLGFISMADPRIEPGESILVWERYFGDQAPRLDLDEIVTVIDEMGEEVVTKPVESFTREELLKYCGKYFWMVKEELLPCSRVLGLAEVTFSQMELLQKSKGWDQIFDATIQEHDFAHIPGTWLQFYPEVVVVRSFTTPVRYLAEDGGDKPLLDPMEVRIFDLSGKEVCRKQISEITEEEFISYCTEHIWSYATDD